MKKNLRTVKTTMIMGILLVSVFAAMVPVSSAKEGGFFGFAHVVEIQWPNIENDTLAIKPFEESRAYNIEVKYTLVKGPLGKLIYRFLYAGRRVNIQLNIESYPAEWSTVTMFDNTITLGLPQDPAEEKTYQHQILISVDDKAPAFREGKIAIRVTVDAVGMIDSFDEVIELTMRPDYSPQLNVVPETQTKVIGPMDTTEIPIKVTNLGNGQTKVSFKVRNVPEDWMAIVTDFIILDPDQTETVYLTVKPSRGFGYHDETESIIIEYYPAWSENLKYRGVTEQISVSIESRGISVIGIEVILPIIILIALVILVIYYFFFRRMRRK